MVIAVDIGNSYLHIGLYKGDKLIKLGKFRHTKKLDETMIRDIFTDLGLKKINHNVKGAAIASVVPKLNPGLVAYLEKQFAVSPIVISSATCCGLKFGYYRPQTLGPDRIANVVGGLARYKNNLIIVDFGTAITLEVVLKTGYYQGGIIAPGIETGLWALTKKTALLPSVVLTRSARIIGQSTEECIQSGLFNGTAKMVQGLIKEIKREVRKRFLCIATGGWSETMMPLISEIDILAPDLCLYGILKIYYNNVASKKGN